MRHSSILATSVICTAFLFGCGDENGENANEEPAKVGFEILQVVSQSEIIVWLGREITREAFDALELPPQSWFKNQPRETDPDAGAFARSPNALADGEFTDEEHFGHLWRHNATIIESNTPLDEQGLLRLNRIEKFHTVTFFEGRTLKILISPEGEQYVRISRDADRLSDQPTLPSSWQLVDYVTPEELILQLPNPTSNIRADNEDSFQGPISELSATP
jgi:hypothetical protein